MDSKRRFLDLETVEPYGGRTGFSKTERIWQGNRRFESTSLQQRIQPSHSASLSLLSIVGPFAMATGHSLARSRAGR
jgi:hypothetical protein